MSSSITKNTTISNDNKEKVKNKKINTFSKNKSHKLFIHHKNTVKNNNKINSTNNNKTTTTSNYNNYSNQLNINTLLEFEFFFNESQNKDVHTKQKTNNKLKNEIKDNNNSSISNNSSFTNIKNNPFNSHMNNILLLKRKYYDNKYKNKQPSRQILLKRKFCQKNFDIFLQSVQKHQIKKETKINYIRSKSIEKESSEIKKHPEMSKHSILLLTTINRKPLYQKRPLNEVKSIDNIVRSFYYKNFDEGNDNSFIKKPDINSRTLDEKFSKFYQDNIKWKKSIEEKNNLKRNNNRQRYEEKIRKYSFKPLLDKNSINIIDKLNRFKGIDNNINNDLTNYRDEKELINRFKSKLKPIIYNNYYNSINKPIINKRSPFMQRNKSDNDMRKKTYHNYDYIYKKRQIKKNENYKLNYTINEKKYQDTKKEKKKDEDNKKMNKKYIKNKDKDLCLIKKLKELKKDKKVKKIELYKLNIRQGMAWNQDVFNKIIPKQKCGHIIEGLL